MIIQERSYSGPIFRPRPEIHWDKSGQLLIIATPWGPRSSAKKAIQVIQDYFVSAQEDEEATSPFARMTCLSPLANHLRIAVKLANDTIYNEDNKREFVSGIELFVMVRHNQEAVWTQIGYPYAFLDRSERPLIAFGTQIDLSTEFSVGDHTLAPLPHKILGIEKSSDFAVETFRPSREDRLILISRSGIPSSFFQIEKENRTLDHLSTVFSKDNPDLPFWLGVVNF
jgi:hypothetical protein